MTNGTGLKSLQDNMYYVYVLISRKDNKFYIGFTQNIKNRIEDHKNGKISSTRFRRPFQLIYCEGHLSKQDALRREKYFKTTKGKATLKQILKDALKSFHQKNSFFSLF